MIFIDNVHLSRIQRLTGWVLTCLALLLLISNLITFENTYIEIINLAYSIFAVTISVASLLKNKNFFRLLQVFLFLFTGVLTYLTKKDLLYIGDFLFILGIFYLYIYRFFKLFSLKKLIPVFVLVIVARIATNILKYPNLKLDYLFSTNIITLFTIAFLVLLIYIFKDEITSYTIRSYHNEKMNRVGMNAANLIHEQSLDHIESGMLDVVEFLDRGQEDAARGTLKALASMVSRHNHRRRIFLDSYNADDGLLDAVFDLNMEMEALVHFEYLNHVKGFNLAPTLELCDEPLCFRGNRYEVTGIFQNLITNAVDAMRRKTERVSHKLLVRTEEEAGKAVITIIDTGPGFPGAGSKGRVDPGKIKSVKKSGGFGFVHIRYFIEKYGGKLEIFNNPGEGATVKISLPVLAGYDLSELIRKSVMETFARNLNKFDFDVNERYYPYALLMQQNEEEITAIMLEILAHAIEEMKANTDANRHILGLATNREHDLGIVRIGYTGWQFLDEQGKKKKEFRLEDIPNPAADGFDYLKTRERLKAYGGSFKVGHGLTRNVLITITFPVL